MVERKVRFATEKGVTPSQGVMNGMIPVAQRVQKNMRWLQMGVVFRSKFIDLKLFQSAVQH